MRLRGTLDFSYLRLLILGLLLAGSPAKAVVTFEILTDDHVAGTPFLNNITGAFFGPGPTFALTSVEDVFNSTSADPNIVPNPGPASIFWEGVNDIPAGGMTFNNVLGSSSFSFGFQNDAFFFQSFNVGFNTHDNPIVFGDNIISNIVRNGNVTDVGPYATATPDGTGQITTIFPNNTATTSNFTTTNGVSNTLLETIAAYWITNEQATNDPTLQSIFTVDLFNDPNLNPLVTRDGVIAHFLNIIDIIETDEDGNEWTLLYYDFSQSTSTDIDPNDPNAVGDFTQVNIGTTLVSYDPGAIPTPVPAAVWLFGTGILGMIVFARRRTSD